jgi:hypothetical protein
MVETAWEYPWTSVRHNAFDEKDDLIDDLPSFLGLSPYAKVRCRHYRRWVQESFDQERDKRLLYGPSMGSDPFRDHMRQRYGLLRRK